MTTTPQRVHVPQTELPPQDEGGLRPPPGLSFWRRMWWWFDFVILVKLARLRFVAILVVIGVIITQWDLLIAYYDKWTRPADVAHVASSEFEWFCPMHPSIVRDNSKEKCPICFMPLSKRKKGEVMAAEPLPAGIVSRVQFSPYRVVLAGVGTWRVSFVPLSREIVATGVVEFNERGQKTVSARMSGRIDELLANETGQMVEAGDVLASIYSPDLIVTVQNLLQAQKAGNQGLVRDARTRLELLGIDTPQIDEIVQTGKANTHLRIHSPIQGHIIQKYVREGQYVEEGTPLYDVADLSTVWIQAQIYEDDISLLPSAHGRPQTPSGEELTVVATTRAFPNEEFRGTLQFIYPHVDQATRTLSVRFEIANPHPHKLRPGSTATVRLFVSPKQVGSLATVGMSDLQLHEFEAGRVVAVPQSAVIDTGDQKIVYRQTSPGEFEGVRVAVGPKMADPHGVVFLPILSGLSVGDQVVNRSSFLVDAETRLNPAAGSIYFGGSSGSKGSSGGTTVRATTPEDPDAKITAALAALSPTDRALAEQQGTCPILPNSRLGSMGTPIKLTLEGETVFICCPGCKDQATENAQKTVERVKELRSRPPQTPPSTEPPKAPPIFAQADSEQQKIAAALATLSPGDRELAGRQQFCAVSDKSRLGSMGTPVKVVVNGETVFLCCDGCKDQALKNAGKTIERVKELRSRSTVAETPKTAPASPASTAVHADPTEKIAAALAKLSLPDRELAEAQRFCAVLEKSRLGSMGTPVKVVLSGEPVFLCCQGCVQAAQKDPKEALDRVKQLRAAGPSKASTSPSMSMGDRR